MEALIRDPHSPTGSRSTQEAGLWEREDFSQLLQGSLTTQKKAKSLTQGKHSTAPCLFPAMKADKHINTHLLKRLKPEEQSTGPALRLQPHQINLHTPVYLRTDGGGCGKVRFGLVQSSPFRNCQFLEAFAFCHSE